MRNLADQLGELRSQIKTLTDDQKELEAILKDKGIRELDGNMYRVAISYDVQRSTTNWAKIAKRFEPSRQLIVANTTVSVHDRISVSALPKH